MTRIGFIGLGQMGRGMAANLWKAGDAFTVHDLSRDAAQPFIEKGAIWAEDPRGMAEECDIIFTSLPTPADVESVALGERGLIAGLASGASWFDLSTNAVDAVRSLHATLAAVGVNFLDAPVSGGASGAANGTLAIWVGGDRDTFDTHRPLLDRMGDQVRYIGPIGTGTIAKLAHNLASAAVGAVMAEVMALGVKAGVEPLPLWDALKHGAIGRQRTFDKVRTLLRGQFDTGGFPVRLLHKDLLLAMQLARQSGVPLRLSGLVADEVTEAMNKGWDGRDSSAFMQLQWTRSGLDPLAISDEEIRALSPD